MTIHNQDHFHSANQFSTIFNFSLRLCAFASSISRKGAETQSELSPLTIWYELRTVIISSCQRFSDLSTHRGFLRNQTRLTSLILFLQILNFFSRYFGKIFQTSETTEKAIPRSLNFLCIKNCIITIDAMGCPTSITQKTSENEADYILLVKRSQKTLL